MTVSVLSELPHPVINGVGYATRVGGSRPRAEVLRAMQWAQQHYFVMDDLLEYASQAIARATGSEAGIVTCGAAAGLTLGAAAILAGDDVEIMEALPETIHLPRRTFLYPERNLFDYDHAVIASGAQLKTFDFETNGLEERLREACTRDVAGVVYVWKHRADNEVIRRVAAVCRHSGIPLLLDGAMCLPPTENLCDVASLGASLVTISGGKHLGGPQNSGLLFGDAALVRSAWLQMVDMDVREHSWSLARLLDQKILSRPPRHGIGRGFKVGKDAILGCLTALELYRSRDFSAERERWHAVSRTIANGLKGGASFKVEYLCENGTGQYPVVKITASERKAMSRLQLALQSQAPKIVLAEDEDCELIAYIYPMCLADDEVDVLVKRMAPIFAI